MSDLIGHQPIWEFLTHADDTDQRAHAYAFLGPRHVGKRFLADRFAKRLLCLADDSTKPCAQCASCLAWNKGIHQDFLLLERAADEHTISIESLRGFLSKLNQSPIQSPRKVAIVDGAEQMLNPVANAFLKHLEEPSASTTIILIVHDRRRLLPTILSRCQTIEFAPVTQAPAGAQEMAWRQARGLPGLYREYEKSPSLAQQHADEEQVIWNLIDMTAGQRLAFLDNYFPKKKIDHALAKQEWANRLRAWQLGLRSAWTPPDATQAPKQANTVALVRIYDELEQTRQGLTQNINIRSHLERLCLTLDDCRTD